VVFYTIDKEQSDIANDEESLLQLVSQGVGRRAMNHELCPQRKRKCSLETETEEQVATKCH